MATTKNGQTPVSDRSMCIQAASLKHNITGNPCSQPLASVAVQGLNIGFPRSDAGTNARECVNIFWHVSALNCVIALFATETQAERHVAAVLRPARAW